MAVNGFAARGQNPTLSSPSLCRQARELSLAAGGSASSTADLKSLTHSRRIGSGTSDRKRY